MFLGKMLTTIKLDYELGCVTQKIGDKISDRYLPSKASSVQPVIAQFRPKNSLGVG